MSGRDVEAELSAFQPMLDAALAEYANRRFAPDSPAHYPPPTDAVTPTMLRFRIGREITYAAWRGILSDEAARLARERGVVVIERMAAQLSTAGL